MHRTWAAHQPLHSLTLFCYLVCLHRFIFSSTFPPLRLRKLQTRRSYRRLLCLPAVKWLDDMSKMPKPHIARLLIANKLHSLPVYPAHTTPLPTLLPLLYLLPFHCLFLIRRHLVLFSSMVYHTFLIRLGLTILPALHTLPRFCPHQTLMTTNTVLALLFVTLPLLPQFHLPSLLSLFLFLLLLFRLSFNLRLLFLLSLILVPHAISPQFCRTLNQFAPSNPTPLKALAGCLSTPSGLALSNYKLPSAILPSTTLSSFPSLLFA
jgi:hypothetical protein